MGSIGWVGVGVGGCTNAAHQQPLLSSRQALNVKLIELRLLSMRASVAKIESIDK